MVLVTFSRDIQSQLELDNSFPILEPWLQALSNTFGEVAEAWGLNLD